MSSSRIKFDSTLASGLLLGLPPQEPRWYAVHTRSRFEKRVAEQLEEKKVFTFLPLLEQLHKWSDRWSKVAVPAFTCYVFVRIVATTEVRVQVLRTTGVLGLVGKEGLGAAIPDEQIESLRTVFREKIPCSVHPFISVGRRVRIRGGSLNGIEGIVVGQNHDRSIVISVEVLGRSISIRADGYDVEPIWSGPSKNATPNSLKSDIVRTS